MAPAGENSPTSAPLYQTDLAQTPLAEILVTIHRYKVPGVVECRRGDEVKRIFLDRGRIVFASTNQISESLGDMLLGEGRITREQYEESIRRVKETRKRHGVTLVEMRLLPADELFVAVQRQIQEIIWTLFTWTTGSATFTPGRDRNLEFVKIDMAVPYAIVHGVRRMPDARAVTARLGTKSTLFARTDRALEDLGLDDDERRLLEAVDSRRALYELVQMPPLGAGENARLLYAFAALQLIAPVEAKKVKIQVQTSGGKSTE
jgi:Domain of unknown function (DUF4388)